MKRTTCDFCGKEITTQTFEADKEDTVVKGGKIIILCELDKHRKWSNKYDGCPKCLQGIDTILQTKIYSENKKYRNT